jgi:glycosyltransferase involved in cell wall biosynthesis
MRVLAVGNMYPPHHLGGYELVWRSATRALRAAGHEARVLTTDHRQPGVEAPDEPDVHRELRWYWRDHAFPRRGPLARRRIERHNARVFDRHVADLRPDVVAWWAMGGMSLALLGRSPAPAVAVVHDDWMLYGPRVDGPLDPTRVALWLFVSEFTRRRALDRYELRETAVLHSGIEASWIGAPAPEREWRGRLLAVGRVDPRKGVDVAIEALPPAATLTVVGDGDPAELARLRALADARTTFAGPLSGAAVRNAYAEADAVVFPVRWDEPWGLVPLEAMALGRPVLASARGGAAEYLRDGENCLVFDPDQPATLTAAVERLAADPALRARLREGGLRTASEHTDARFNAALVEALERVAS